MKLNQIDWWDVAGMFLTYAGLAMLALTIVFKENNGLVNLLLIGLGVCFSLVTLLWKKFRWGVRTSYWLFFLIFAILGALPAMALMSRKQIFKRRLE